MGKRKRQENDKIEKDYAFKGKMKEKERENKRKEERAFQHDSLEEKRREQLQQERENLGIRKTRKKASTKQGKR